MAPNEPNQPLAPPVGAVIFDLDGTLTQPYFDFAAIRREMGLNDTPELPILEAMDRMNPAQRQVAEDILHRHERQAALESQLRKDTPEVLTAIRAAKIPIGLLTRNSRASVDTVLSLHPLKFDAICCREDGPIKPAPDSVLALCRRFGCPPSNAWVVGDHLFDILAGNAAGATSVLLVGNGSQPDGVSQADHVIHRLRDLLRLLGLMTA